MAAKRQRSHFPYYKSVYYQNDFGTFKLKYYIIVF